MKFKEYLEVNDSQNLLDKILECVVKYPIRHRIFRGGMFKNPNSYDVILEDSPGLYEELHKKYEFGKVRGIDPHLIRRIKDGITVEVGNPHWINYKDDPIVKVSICAEYQKFFTEDVIKMLDEKLDIQDEQILYTK